MSQDLNFDLQWWVYEAMQDTTSKVSAITAGLNSGKTHGLWQWLLQRVKQNPDVPMFAFCEPQNSLLFDVAVPTFEDVAASFGWQEDREWVLVKSPRPSIKLWTGQEVRLVGLENPSKIKGWQSGATAVDEPGVCRKSSISRVRERTRHKNANILPQMLLGGTPEGFNHYSETFDSDRMPGWDIAKRRDHAVTRETAEGDVQYRRYRVTSYDNPYCPKGYIQDVLDEHRANPEMIDSYIYGKFADFAKGQAYREYHSEEHRHEEEPSPHSTLVISWDFNVQPLAWTAWQKRLMEDGVKHLSVGESTGKSSTIVDGCVEIIKMFNPKIYKRTPIKIQGDANGYVRSIRARGTTYDEILEILEEYYDDVEIIARKYNPAVADRVELVNRAFMDGIALIHKEDVNTSKSLTATTWKPGTRELSKPPQDMLTHWGDETGYYLYHELMDERESKLTLPDFIY